MEARRARQREISSRYVRLSKLGYVLVCEEPKGGTTQKEEEEWEEEDRLEPSQDHQLSDLPLLDLGSLLSLLAIFRLASEVKEGVLVDSLLSEVLVKRVVELPLPDEDADLRRSKEEGGVVEGVEIGRGTSDSVARGDRSEGVDN